MSEGRQHELFADWYRQVDLEPSPEVLARRWDCVEAALSALSVAGLYDLTRILYSLPESAEEPGAELTKACKEADSTFPLKDNKELLRVLAGATLAQCIKERHELAPLAALSLVCVWCRDAGPRPLLPDVLSAGRAYLDEESQKIRHDPMKPPDQSSRFRHPKVPKIAALSPLADPGSDFTLIKQHLDSIQKTVNQVTSAIAGLNAHFENLVEDSKKGLSRVADSRRDPRVRVLEEETEILWWLFAEHSDELASPLGDLEMLSASMVLGSELASLTRLALPVPAADAFLRRALSNTMGGYASEQRSLRQVVESAPEDWRREWSAKWAEQVRRTSSLTPVAMAIVGSAEGLDLADWARVYKAKGAIDPDATLETLRWSRQLYDECLLLRAEMSAERKS